MYLYIGSGDGSLNHMTSNKGLSAEGGLVSHGRRALLPKSPDTLATGTTPLAEVASARIRLFDQLFSMGEMVSRLQATAVLLTRRLKVRDDRP